MKIDNHPFFSSTPYGTGFFIVNRSDIRSMLWLSIIWSLIGAIGGTAYSIIAYLYVQAGLAVPIVMYILIGMSILILVVYLPYFIYKWKELRSLKKAHFQYLENFKKFFENK